MNNYISSNPIYNPNMLLLFVLISIYSQECIYNWDEKMLNKQHLRESNRNARKTRHIDYKENIYNNLDYSKVLKSSDDKLSSNVPTGTSNCNAKESGNIDYPEGSYSTGNPSCQKAASNMINDCCLEKDEDLARLNPSNNLDCGGIVNSEFVTEYPNKLLATDSVCDQLLINIPIVLSQFEIEFPCEVIISLDYPTLDIKRIEESVSLDECMLLPKTNKLFIGGIVRKNIEYSTESSIRNATVEVPFKCTTRVEYFTPPVINLDEAQIEIESLRSDGTGNDLSEMTYIKSKHFNEKIYYKLISNEIKELDITNECDGENENPNCEKFFETLTSKMVVKLNIKLLQEQDIFIGK